MSERKAVVKNADMSEDMQRAAVDCATRVSVRAPEKASRACVPRASLSPLRTSRVIIYPSWIHAYALHIIIKIMLMYLYSALWSTNYTLLIFRPRAICVRVILVSRRYN